MLHTQSKNFFKRQVMFMTRYAILTVAACCTSVPILAQRYDLRISEQTVRVDTLQESGYSSTFDLPAKETKKVWWAYIKKKAYFTNYVTHYRIRVPASKEANQIWSFYSVVVEDTANRVSHLQLALMPDTGDDEARPTLDKQLKQLLIDFKTSFYTGRIQAQIDDLENQVIKYSREIELLRSKNATLGQRMTKKPDLAPSSKFTMLKNEEKIQTLQDQIGQNNVALDKLKRQLAPVR